MLKAVLTIVHGTDSFPGSEQYYLKFTSDTRRGNPEYHLAKHLSVGAPTLTAGIVPFETEQWLEKVYEFVRVLAKGGIAEKVPNIEIKFLKPKGSLLPAKAHCSQLNKFERAMVC